MAKCIVNGCQHQTDDGSFANGGAASICMPCYTMLTTGKVGHGETFVHQLAGALNDLYDLVKGLKPDADDILEKHNVKTRGSGELR